MTKQEALYNFFNGFGLTAYPSTAVPSDTAFPWLTYEAVTGYKGDDPVSSTVQLWYHTESEAVPNAKVSMIENLVGIGGKLITYDDGVIWVKRGEPWCVPSTQEDDNSIKVRQLNFEFEFI